MSKRLVVEFTDTLMRWAGEFHVQSGDRLSTFYFRVPDAWLNGTDADLQKLTFAVAQKMYQDLNAHFRAAAPEDLGYLLVKDTKARVLTEAEQREAPWLRAASPAIWEPTPCVIVLDDDMYEKVQRDEF